jgi:methionyl-tRNA formyltransferase
MLRSVLGDLDSGTAEMEPQDDRLATTAPRVALSARMVDFSSWPAERVWHFLKGLFPKYREQLQDGRGSAVVYAGVGAWRREEHASVPGTVTRTDGGWLLWCTDGCVELDTA